MLKYCCEKLFNFKENSAIEVPTKVGAPVQSGKDGILLALQRHKYVSPAESIAKIVGKEPEENRKSGAWMEI